MTKDLTYFVEFSLGECREMEFYLNKLRDYMKEDKYSPKDIKRVEYYEKRFKSFFSPISIEEELMRR
jgi:hypothetical protein